MTTITKFAEQITETYPHIEWTEFAIDKLNEIAERWDSLSQDAQWQFHERLLYLENYGAHDDERRFIVRLVSDWADMSFGILWYNRNQDGTKGDLWMNGGFVWHGGPNEEFCVSLTPQYWGIHT